VPDLAAWSEKLQREGSVLIDVKVIPRAGKSEIAGFMSDGSLKARVAAVPEKGKANEELRDLLSGYFGVAKNKVEVVLGQTSQHKRVRVSR
jgi:uncharacterized protein (TIGR00251 family)